MTNSIRVGVQLWPGGTPDYRTWREAVLTAEELGADAIFGYDHFHKPFTVPSEDGLPQLLPEQLDVNNFEGWTALASWAEITSHAELGSAGHRDRLPQSRPVGRHGPHRRPHQRWPADSRPGLGLVRKGLHRLRIRLRYGQVSDGSVRGRPRAHREPARPSWCRRLCARSRS